MAEQTGFTKHAHQLDMSRIAKRLLLHEWHVQEVREAAQTISVEGLQRTNAVEVDEFRFAERFANDNLAMFHDSRGPGVLLDDIVWRKAGLVLKWPAALARQAADINLYVIALI